MNVNGGSCEESKFDHSHSYVRIGAQPVLRSRSSANLTNDGAGWILWAASTVFAR